VIVDEAGNIRWKAVIGLLARERVRLTQLRPDIYPLPAPHLGASDADVAAAVARVGPLDAQHEGLLRQADGWPEAFMFGDVLSTAELGAGPLWDKATQSLRVFYEDGPSTGWPPLAELVLVHACEHDTDVTAVWMGGPLTDGGHPVYWIGGDIIDTYPNIYQWWLSMAEYAKRSVADFAAEQGGPAMRRTQPRDRR